MRSVAFDIVNDVIDFKNTPVLCEYERQCRTLMRRGNDPQNHYDHWSDKYMSLEMVGGDAKTPRITLNYKDAGYNFETIYLKWRLPMGCQVKDTIDRLGGYLFGSTA